jgi:hypothetical protein
MRFLFQFSIPDSQLSLLCLWELPLYIVRAFDSRFLLLG